MDQRQDPADDDDSPRQTPKAIAAPAHSSVIIELLDPAHLLTGPERARLDALLQALAHHLTAQGLTGEARIEAVDDTRMAALHAAHMGIQDTTDVLTFNLSASESTLDTDILVCIDEARRQSALRNLGPAEELALYAVHGILHCAGYDDHTETGPRGSIAMHQREDEILTAIGAGTVYATLPRGDEP